MEPKLPTPNLGPERIPSMYGQGNERTLHEATSERGFEKQSEKLERPVESASDAAHAAASPILPQPVLTPPVLPTTTDDSVINDSIPLVAGDDDLIEKEWVDKAKKIIAETKDDPYKREYEVGKLQADYLRKRYGKELGAPQ